MIEKVNIYELDIVEIEGEFKKVQKNHEVLPCMLTNYSLYVGKRDGLLETSLTDELFKVIEVYESNPMRPEDVGEEDLEQYGIEMFKGMKDAVDEEKIIKIIYLGLIGANPKLKYSFEDFVLRFHADVEEKMMLYVNLISNLASRDNKFKREFEKHTSRKREKGEKK